MRAALALASLQKRWFFSVPQRYAQSFNAQALELISSIINAGIGITVGTVVMGDLGPKRGVREFGILGDPINSANRIESLTRLFSTNIIFTGDIVGIASALGFRRCVWDELALRAEKIPRCFMPWVILWVDTFTS